MSKSLEALERLKNTLLAEGYWQDVLQDVFTIEKDLKEKEELAQALSIVTCENGDLLKHKKALGIIKKKKVSTEYFTGVCKLFRNHKGKVWVWGNIYTSELEYYNHFLYPRRIGEPPISAYKKRRYLTQKDFDLLKEVIV